MMPLYVMIGCLFVMMLSFTLPTIVSDARLRRERRRGDERHARSSEPEGRFRRHGLRGIPRVRHAGRGA